VDRYEGEPDMEQVEEWARFRREVLASPPLVGMEAVA